MERYGIEADYEKTGMLVVAREPHEADELSELAEQLRGSATTREYLDQATACGREVDSPTYSGGTLAADRQRDRRSGPAGLGAGRRRGVELGVRIHEARR